MRRHRRSRMCVLLTSVFASAWLGCGRPEAPSIRNVVLVSLDAVGALHSGAYGYPRETTPRLDRLAEAGTLFENAYTNQVWTLTSHVTMLTGLYPQAHGVSQERPAAPGATTLTQLLADEGFATAAFTGVGGYMAPDFGLGRGFDRYVPGVSDAARDNVPRLRWLDEQAALRERDPDHRFFLFAHYYDAHSDAGTRIPYAAPGRHALRFLDGELDWDRRGDASLLVELERQGNVTARDREVVTALYDAGVRYTDEVGLGPLLDALDANGFGADTLVIVTSDHGEEIFEHGACSHQQPYEETARVPLVMVGPAIAAGRRVAAPVELVDLVPTVLSLLDLPIPPQVQGRDLSRFLLDDPPPPDAPRDVFVDGILGGVPHVYWRYPSSITGEVEGLRYSLVSKVRVDGPAGARRFSLEGDSELYRMDLDPRQERDVAKAHPSVAAELQRRLLRWYAENDRMVRALGGGGDEDEQSPLDAEDRKRLEALGYIHQD